MIFLAYGNAALGVIDLIKQSGANLVGMGFIIEKAFQNGRKTLEERGSKSRVSCHHRRFIQLPDYNKRLTIKETFVFSLNRSYKGFFTYQYAYYYWAAASCEILTLDLNTVLYV